jgi:prevent-host-death family protein
MHYVNIHEAKTQLSRLLQCVAEGQDVVIAKAGTPIARLVPYRIAGKPRVPGAWRGRVQMADDFDELPEDIAAAFRGEAP